MIRRYMMLLYGLNYSLLITALAHKYLHLKLNASKTKLCVFFKEIFFLNR